MSRSLSNVAFLYFAYGFGLQVLAEKAEASTQQALEWLVDFEMAEPTRSRAAERFIRVQAHVVRRNTR